MHIGLPVEGMGPILTEQDLLQKTAAYLQPATPPKPFSFNQAVIDEIDQQEMQKLAARLDEELHPENPVAIQTADRAAQAAFSMADRLEQELDHVEQQELRHRGESSRQQARVG